MKKEKNVEKILLFYKQTSCFTDLGKYKSFAKKLPNSIKKLCLLQRHQIVHPFDLFDEEERKDSNSFYGDMTKISRFRLNFENDFFPTAQAMLHELLRRDKCYSVKRKIEDKIHVCCREQAILLASILKAKGISARVRSGFAFYVTTIDSAGDHWIVEYFNKKEGRWILVDPDMHFDKLTLDKYKVDFNLIDLPREKFIFGAEAYLNLRKGIFKEKDIYYASRPLLYGLPGALHGLFYDFHSLMNNEIPFLYLPKYIVEKNFILTEEEYIELDSLAHLLLHPDENFDALLNIWNTKDKFRILKGGMNC